MPGENESEKDVGKDDDTGEGKEKTMTLESLAETVASIPEMIKAVKDESAQAVTDILRQVQEDRDLTKGDMENLLSLLGGFANPDKEAEAEAAAAEGVATVGQIKEIASKAVDDNTAADKEKLTADQKAYFTEYAEYTQDLLDEEFGPDSKPLSPEARKGIMELLRTDILDIHSKSGTRDAIKNFRKATRIYFGLDKTHAFERKADSTAGTGQAGGKEQGAEPSVKKRVYSDASKEFFKQIGVTEEWADKKVAEREEAAV